MTHRVVAGFTASHATLGLVHGSLLPPHHRNITAPQQKDNFKPYKTKIWRLNSKTSDLDNTSERDNSMRSVTLSTEARNHR